MDSARWERIQALFHDAVDLPLGERGAFLRDACGRDDALLAEVLASLDEDERGGSLLDEGVANAARRVLGDDPATLRQIGPYSILRTLGEGGMGVCTSPSERTWGRWWRSRFCGTRGCRRRGACALPANSARWPSSIIRASRGCTTPGRSRRARPGSSWSTSKAFR